MATMIPQGTYRGVLAGSGALAFAKTEKQGTENVQIQMRFTKAPADVIGQVRTWFGYFSDASWQRTFEVLRYLYPAWTTDRAADLVRISREAIEEREVELVVEHEMYDNKPREKLAWINVPRTFGEPMTEDDLEAFSRRWAPSVATVKPAAAPRTAAPARSSSTAGSGSSSAPPPARRGGGGFGDDDAPPPDDRDQPPPRGGHPFGGR